MAGSRTRCATCCASWPRATGDTSSWRSAPTSSERLAVGYVLGAKGLRGRLKVETLSDRPERLAPGSALYLDGEARSRLVTAVEGSRRATVIELEGVADRTAAEALVGRYLEVDRDELPPDTYYWDDLIGIVVHDEADALVGEIDEVFRAGENEVYRVVGPAGETLIPGLREVVRELDVRGRTMVVRLETEEID